MQSTKSTEPNDQPHLRADMETMTDAQIEHVVTAIRARRLRVIAAADEAKRMKENATVEQNRAKAEKVETSIRKALAAADKALAKAEEKAAQLRALRLQIEDAST